MAAIARPGASPDELKLAIMALAKDTDCESEALVLAMADVLASLAIVLDREEGRLRSSLDQRLDTFVVRVRERYVVLRHASERRAV